MVAATAAVPQPSQSPTPHKKQTCDNNQQPKTNYHNFNNHIDDHINNTPRQMQMLRALGVEPPQYAHLPMILGPDGAKLSKRHGAVR